MKIDFKNILLYFLIIASILCAEEPAWQIIGKMKYPVSGARAVVKDSSIYLIGGYSDSLQANVKWIQRYDPVENTWTIVANMIEKRYGLSIGIHYDKLYIYGGINEVNDNSYNLEEWDFISSTTTVYSTNDLFDRVFSTSIVKDDALLMIGGYAGSRGSSADLPYIAKFDLLSQQISSVNDTSYISNELPIQQMSVRVDDNLFIMGGAYNGVLQNIDVLDLNNYSSEEFKPRSISPRAAGVSLYSQYSGVIYLIGGYNETSSAIASTEIISNFEDEPIVSLSSPLNYARRNHSAVVFGEKIFVFGGESIAGSVVDFVEEIYAGPVSVDDEPVKNHLDLFQNYPNPFNPETLISYTLKEPSNIRIEVFNSLGEKVSTLFSGYSQPGFSTVSWKGKDNAGNIVPSGIYFYRLSSGSNFITKKMLLLK